jgi:hypothetical protein
MISGAQRLRMSIRRGWMGLPGVLLGYQALRWRVPGTNLGAVVPSDALLGC